LIEFSWSKTEKTIARAAFDRALERELKAIRLEVQGMLSRAASDRVVWEILDYLREKQREVDERYDFRYSQLVRVFAILVREGWLNEDELAGLAPDKLEAIRKILSIR
jgi:hypothetical protein